MPVASSALAWAYKDQPMLLLLLALLISQYQFDPIRSAEAMERATRAQARPLHPLDPRFTAHQRQQFEEKFNQLIQAVSEFAREYNQSEGHLWPAKKAEALKKAIQDLQKTDAWPGGKPCP
jgi:hypothetical protein